MNSVLDFAKLDAGRMEYHIQPVAVAAAIRDAECIVAPLAEARGVSFPRVCAHSHLVVLADREKLAQILVNLFSNAVKFTSAGGRVSLRCDQEGDRVLFHVEDTGVGIAPEHLQHVFEPFMQVSEGHTRKEEGTGLGLAISRTLARGTGGEISVRSMPGKGSTFTLDLPQASDAPLAADVIVRALEIEDRRSGEERRTPGDRRGAAAERKDPIPL